MKRTTRATERALRTLETQRQEVESRLADIQRAFDREIGWAPTKKVWVLPVVAFALGLAVAMATRARK